MAQKESPFAYSFRNYSLLTKPGIIFGNAVTATAGYALGAGRWQGYFPMLIGLCLIIASACVYNNYIDRYRDQRMDRTKNRPLAKGTISENRAIVFATILILLGVLVLGLGVNLPAMWAALLGFGIYVFLYSYSKYQTSYSTLIGSIAGSMPPVVGYTASSGKFDLATLLLFLLVTFWQMPHFYSIAIRRLEDYRAAGVPTLPLKRGLIQTKLRMFFYIAGFIFVSLLLTTFDFTSGRFMAVAFILGFGWLILCIRGATAEDPTQWAKKMFFFSLLVIMGVSGATFL